MLLQYKDMCQPETASYVAPSNRTLRIRARGSESSVVDPDPHPAFQVNPDPDTDLIQDFDDQKLKKKNIQMKNLLDQKL